MVRECEPESSSSHDCACSSNNSIITVPSIRTVNMRRLSRDLKTCMHVYSMRGTACQYEEGEIERQSGIARKNTEIEKHLQITRLHN